jgi:hypothetical protein
VVLWDRWISELVADFWSVAKLGVSSTLGLIQVLSLPRAFVFHLHPTDPHPFAWIRVHASCAMGHALFPHPQWAGVATFWDQLYPLRNSSALGALTRRLRDHTAIFAEEMAGHRPRALRGQSLREALAVDQRTPGRLLEIYRSNAANPSALAALPPTLGMAALSRLPEVLRHVRAEPMVSGWTHPDRAIRRSVGRSVEACCERLNKRTTPDFIGAFGQLLRLQKVSLLPSLPSVRAWNAARSIVGSNAILLSERHLRWLMANDPVDLA